ncbi:TetR/AcrR family transcriptional regulator [Flavimaricola marinus]|uniref:TetR/AcrR family transcriptional regulator n=1 Tax=Flavimaricola marinus TaxID=1819565 RepID=UPI001455952A|nr:helix-turn-helix domain-containing protein [Flavimaricola marinus]
MNAAKVVFGASGIDAASVEEIARRASETRKAVYNQFAPKEDVADQMLARMEASVEPLYRDRIPSDENTDFLSTALLGNYAQAMITVISDFPYDPKQIRRIVRVLIECIGRTHSNSSPGRSETARGMTPSVIAPD